MMDNPQDFTRQQASDTDDGRDTTDVACPVFDALARRMFAANYPETPHILKHHLSESPLLNLERLAQLAGELPVSSIEFNQGDLPIGVDGKPDPTGRTIEDTILHIATSNSWAVLKNIEQNPAYEALLLSLLGEIRPEIEARTGAMLRPQGFIFISSPNAVTPYHFDPEHNILLQLKGSKVMTQFPAGDARFAPDIVHETYHSGGARELSWDDSFAAHGTDFALQAGEALFVPVMAPHYVRNGPTSSLSLSITWRSNWSFEESDARIFNSLLRQAGMQPAAPRRWPGSNRAKAYSYRALRKLRLTG